MGRPRSLECRAKQAEAARKRWADPIERLAQSERMKQSAPWKGKRLSVEHREHISIGGKGVPHTITEDRKLELGIQGRDVLSRNLKNPAVRAKLGAAQARIWKELGASHPLISPQARAKSTQAKILNGTLSPQGCGRGITGFRKGIPHYCRSTLEANFARILQHTGIPYEYEPKVFLLPGGKRWTPDFLLKGPLGDKVPAGWVELKGWRKKDGGLPGDADDKITMFQQMTGMPVFVLCQDSALWKEIEACYSNQVDWECPNYNLRTHPDIFGGE